MLKEYGPVQLIIMEMGFILPLVVNFSEMTQLENVTSTLSGFQNMMHGQHKAEWLGNDNRKTMIKLKTTG